MPGTRRPALALACIALLGGCAGGGRADAGQSTSAEEEACVKLLRELRLYCQEGIVEDDRTSFRMPCMSRRLAFDRQCMPPRGG